MKLIRAAATALASLVVFAASCSGGNPATTPPPPTDAGASDAPLLMPPDLARTMSEAQLAPQRNSCTFQTGAWAAQTIGTDYPIGADIPIKHVIVIMQENRSFDHYLGRLVAQGYYQAGDFTPGGSGFQSHDQVDVPPADWTIPDRQGNPIPPHPDNEFCYGVDHSWNTQHANYDNGKNDHFAIDNDQDTGNSDPLDPTGSRTMFYEDDTVIPFYYALANNFAIGDRYFCSAMTSTWPNRMFLMAGTSFGIGDNSFDQLDTKATPAPVIFKLLEEGGHTWKDYTDGPHQLDFFPTFGFSHDALIHEGDIKCDLMTDITNNTLPDVSLVMGDEFDEFSDEGPSNLPGIGGELVEKIIRNLWASPAWKDTAVFIVYDENGGIADHVPPAPACAPDGYTTPHDQNGTPFVGDFTQTGFRVPLIVVSPYARPHYVSHTVFDHTAVTRFIETRFGLPALTARDANAAPMMELFDFSHPAFMTPPTVTATTSVPPGILTQCKQTEAPIGCPMN